MLALLAALQVALDRLAQVPPPRSLAGVEGTERAYLLPRALKALDLFHLLSSWSADDQLAGRCGFAADPVNQFDLFEVEPPKDIAHFRRVVQGQNKPALKSL